MFKKIKSAGKKNVAIEEHKSSLEPANEKDPRDRGRKETEEERRERRRSERGDKGELVACYYMLCLCINLFIG